MSTASPSLAHQECRGSFRGGWGSHVALSPRRASPTVSTHPRSSCWRVEMVNPVQSTIQGSSPPMQQREICARSPQREICTRSPQREVCARSPQREVCARSLQREICARSPPRARGYIGDVVRNGVASSGQLRQPHTDRSHLMQMSPRNTLNNAAPAMCKQTAKPNVSTPGVPCRPQSPRPPPNSPEKTSQNQYGQSIHGTAAGLPHPPPLRRMPIPPFAPSAALDMQRSSFSNTAPSAAEPSTIAPSTTAPTCGGCSTSPSAHTPRTQCTGCTPRPDKELSSAPSSPDSPLIDNPFELNLPKMPQTARTHRAKLEEAHPQPSTLDNLQSNPFELIPRASEVSTSASQLLSTQAFDMFVKADSSPILLNLLHEESERTLERFMQNVSDMRRRAESTPPCSNSRATAHKPCLQASDEIIRPASPTEPQTTTLFSARSCGSCSQASEPVQAATPIRASTPVPPAQETAATHLTVHEHWRQPRQARQPRQPRQPSPLDPSTTPRNVWQQSADKLPDEELICSPQKLGCAEVQHSSGSTALTSSLPTVPSLRLPPLHSSSSGATQPSSARNPPGFGEAPAECLWHAGGGDCSTFDRDHLLSAPLQEVTQQLQPAAPSEQMPITPPRSACASQTPGSLRGTDSRSSVGMVDPDAEAVATAAKRMVNLLQEHEAEVQAFAVACNPSSVQCRPAGHQASLDIHSVLTNHISSCPNIHVGGDAQYAEYSFQEPCPRYTVKAVAHTLGGRKHRNPNWVNQDAHLIVPMGPSLLFVAVFDGHGEHGHSIAEGVRDLCAHYAPGLPGSVGAVTLPEALGRLFALAQDGLERGGLAEWSGTTAAVAVIDAAAGTITTAHIGDARAVVVKGSQVTFETTDHDIDCAAEQRILASGGEVRELTISGITARRVFLRGLDFPGLSMARALGDLRVHAVGVLSEPSINTGVEFGPSSTLIIASDGVWEKVPASEAAACISNTPPPEDAAQRLVAEARAKWPQDGSDIDDITAVVVTTMPEAYWSGQA